MDLGEDTPTAVFMLGGGGTVEPAWFGCPGEAVSDSFENAVYLVDAASGSVLWRASGPGSVQDAPVSLSNYEHPQLVHGVAAALTPVDSNANGIVDRAYVVDTGGLLWRLDLPEAGSHFEGTLVEVLDAYRIRPIADLGGDGLDQRRFMLQADFVRSRDGTGDYDGILLVSGDGAGDTEREVQNYVYLIKDRGGPVVTHESLVDSTGICSSRDNPECQSADLSDGWKLALAGTPETGVSRPLVSRGVVYFSTWSPEQGEASCDVESGDAQVYAVQLADGSPTGWQALSPEAGPNQPVGRSKFAGKGLPGPVSPWHDQIQLPAGGDPGVQLILPGGELRWRIYWREEGVDIQ